MRKRHARNLKREPMLAARKCFEREEMVQLLRMSAADYALDETLAQLQHVVASRWHSQLQLGAQGLW